MNSLSDVYQCTIKPDWVDYNNHLNDAYYGVVFSLASEGLFDELGLGAQWREEQARTIYTLDVRTRYLREIHAGASLEVKAQLLDSDSRRLHFVLYLFVQGDKTLRATSEQVVMCIDPELTRAASFDSEAQVRIQTLQRLHQSAKKPLTVGRPMGLR